MKYLVLSLMLLLSSCVRDGERMVGNGEAYAGLRPKDGSYFWVDSRAYCKKNGVEITGYRAVIEVSGSNPVTFRYACDTTTTNVSLFQLLVSIFASTSAAAESDGVLGFKGGVFDRRESADTITVNEVSTRAVVSFKSGQKRYEAIVRGKGALDTAVETVAYLLDAESTTPLLTVPVVASLAGTDVRLYSGTDFTLRLRYAGTTLTEATLVTKVNGTALSLSSTTASDTLVLTPPPASDPSTSARAILLSAGNGFSCGAWDTAKTLQCWGSNTNGLLGNDTQTDSASPTPVTLAVGVTAVSAGNTHACAINAAGAHCWGQNNFGQLGNQTHSPFEKRPVRVSLNNVTAISAGYESTCAISNKKVYCWGHNSAGQLGTGNYANNNVPTLPVSSIPEDVSAITMGLMHTCAITVSGDVYCWGNNLAGQIGLGSAGGLLPSPMKLNGLKLVSISANNNSTCGINPQGKPICWGENQSAEVSGDGTPTSFVATPSEVLGVTLPITSLSMGMNAACAVHGGSVTCWGSNIMGATANGQNNGISPAQMVSGITGAETVTCGTRHCLLKSVSSLKAWGNNIFGQLGNGTTTSTGAPVLLPFPTF